MTLQGNRFLATGAVCALAVGMCAWVFWVLPFSSDFGDITMIAEEGEELDRIGQQLMARVDAKDRVCADLVAGRLPLLEAAAQFRDITVAGSRFRWDEFRSASPHQTDDEHFCRLMLLWAKDRAESGQTQSPVDIAVLERLQEELERRREQRTLLLRPTTSPAEALTNGGPGKRGTAVGSSCWR